MTMATQSTRGSVSMRNGRNGPRNHRIRARASAPTAERTHRSVSLLTKLGRFASCFALASDMGLPRKRLQESDFDTAVLFPIFRRVVREERHALAHSFGHDTLSTCGQLPANDVARSFRPSQRELVV